MIFSQVKEYDIFTNEKKKKKKKKKKKIQIDVIFTNENPQSMFWAEIWKISEILYLKIFRFLEVKFSIYLNRHAFVMLS